MVGFIREAWHVVLPDVPYVHGWHIDLLAEHLEAITFGRMIADGYENRFLANVPPGTMKSLLVSVFWPAFEMGPGGKAHFQYVVTAFREDNLVRDQNRFRKLVKSDWFQQRWPMTIVKDSEEWFENSRGGWRTITPFGSLTGGRGDRLIVDDPHSIDTAESDLERNRATMRFRESATTRMNDPITSAIVVIMQRLHERDVSGIISEYKMPYIHVMLPMRFEVSRACVTPYGKDPRRKEGELLFPERFPKNVVDRDEGAMGAYAVAGQMQQRPSPRGGLLFQRSWFKVVDAAPGHCRWVRGWDLAASEEKTSAFSAGCLIGHDMKQRHYYIKDVVRERVPNPETIIVNTATQDGHDVEIDIPQDPGQAGKIQARSIVGALAGYRAFYSPESGDKISRADPLAAQAKAGNVFLVKGPWNTAFLDEVASFPTGFKDQIDAASRAFSRFILIPFAGSVGPIPIAGQSGYFGDNPNAY